MVGIGAWVGAGWAVEVEVEAVVVVAVVRGWGREGRRGREGEGTGVVLMGGRGGMRWWAGTVIVANC